MRNRCLEQDKLHIDKSFKFPGGFEKCKLWDFSICSLEQNLVQQLALSERKPIFDIIWQFLTAINFFGLHQYHAIVCWCMDTSSILHSYTLKYHLNHTHRIKVGSYTVLPCLQSFCVYAAVSIFAIYALQVDQHAFALCSMLKLMIRTLMVILIIHLHAYHLSPFPSFCQVMIVTCSGDALCCLVCPGYSKAYSPYIHLSS